jgi:DNA segregation ATPase FtsK/SpoIIIE-like protein
MSFDQPTEANRVSPTTRRLAHGAMRESAAESRKRDMAERSNREGRRKLREWNDWLDRRDLKDGTGDDETVVTESSAPIPEPVTRVNRSDADLLKEAIEVIVGSQLGSVALLQRKLRIGHDQAERLMGLMERTGVVGPAQDRMARVVLRPPLDAHGD